MAAGVPQAIYQVILYSTAGNALVTMTDWTALTYSRRVIDVGQWAITISEPSQVGVPITALPAMFVEDAPVAIRRKIGTGAWYTDFIGLVRDIAWMTDEAGNRTFTASGVSPLDLLARRTIAYPAGTPQTEKYRATAGSVISEFVEENAGPSATFANGRLDDGVTPNLAVGTLAIGSHWDGARFQDNLLDVIKGISADVGDVEFEMAATVGGGSVAWLFAPVARIGTDKSATVIFSKLQGNVGAPTYNLARRASRNRVFVLGPGEEADRVTVTVDNVTAQAGSPWALSEMRRDATQQNTASSMAAVGAEALEAAKPFHQVAFTPIETASSRYGITYDLGDTVTTIVDDETSHVLRIMAITVQSQGGASGIEAISFEVTLVR